MNIHAIVCTRDRSNVSPTTDKLIKYLVSSHIKPCIMSGASSIFSAYQGAFDHLNPEPEDIIIMCHDDIEIREEPEIFVRKLTDALAIDSIGFVGAAGTTFLSADAIWWNKDCWKMGKHRGKVTHIDNNQQEYLTQYGPPDEVVVLDGLFLAARPKVLRDIGLSKPDYFEGEWDYYDIYYTSQAFFKGYTNKAIDIHIVHRSIGELVGRDSWAKNRAAFIAHNPLPIVLHQ